MSPRNRYLVFFIGVLIGSIIVIPVFRERWSARSQRIVFDETKQLPGMFVEAALTGLPIREENEKFILEESTAPASEGFSHRRVFITGGRRKFEKTGRDAPNSFLKITEDYAEEKPTAMTPVKQFTFAYADRVAVSLAVGASLVDLEKLVSVQGARIETGQGGAVVVRLAGHTLADVPAMISFLNNNPAVVSSATEVVIDWRAEAK